jgi:hypothetical protein
MRGWHNLDPRQGLDPSARGLVSGERLSLKSLVSGERSSFKGGAPGGGGLGGWPGGGRGLVPDCLGWLRVVRGPKKAFGCKLWGAIGLPLLRFPWAWGLPHSPRPPAGGFALYPKGCVPAKSAGAPTPAGPRVRVPRPTGDGAG